MINKPLPLEQPSSTGGGKDVKEDVKEADEGEENAEEGIMISFVEEAVALRQWTISNC